MVSVYLAYGMFTGQAGWSPKSLKGRAMAATWGFLMLVLISSYTANLAAQITKKGADFKPASLEEFVGGPFKACTLDGSAYTQWLKNSEQYGHIVYVEGGGTDVSQESVAHTEVNHRPYDLINSFSSPHRPTHARAGDGPRSG